MGGLHGFNPEIGYLGSRLRNQLTRRIRNAMESISSGHHLNECRVDPRWGPLGGSKDNDPPKGLLDGEANHWDPDLGKPAAHPNSRFCAPMKNNPALDERKRSGRGLLLMWIIVGGRQSNDDSRSCSAFNWIHGST